jgi:2-enoate reductase
MSRSIIFEPIKIGKVQIKNKIAMAPMGAFGLVDESCCFNQRAIDYYVERAKGGTGLIITSVCKVENELDQIVPGVLPCTSLKPARFVLTSSEMTERIHAYGSKVFLQLSMGFGRSGAPGTLLTKQPVSASAIPNYWDPTVTCRELTTNEVEWIVKKFGEAATIAKHAGYDGVEIHAVHEGYLLDQFTLAMFNRRTDKYGGDLKGRLTLPTEILREIKKTVGEDFPVMLRFSIKSCIKDWRQGGLPDEDYEEKGRSLEEGLAAAKILSAAGYDAFNADAGTYDAWYWAHPPIYQKHGLYLDYTDKLKEVTDKPVIVAGKLDIPEMAENALKDKKADMIVLGRALLADPYWPKKVKTGHEQSIRPCIGCHVGCMGRGFEGKHLSCAVNPACGRERYYEIKKACISKKVMIVGGGIAGMEAARITKMRGHEVTLYEASGQLGGSVIPGSVPEFKFDDRRLLDWYKTEMKDLGIAVIFNITVTEELIDQEKPDTLILATGATEKKPTVHGIDKDKVSTAVEVLNGTKQTGKTVLMVGGGLVGCETALWLAQKGKDVTVVEALGSILSAGKPVPHMNKIMLIDLMKYNHVQTITNTCLLKVTDDGAVLIDNKFRKQAVKAESIVICVGFSSNNALYEKVHMKVDDVYLVGDAENAANIMEAIWAANEVALNI